MITLELIQAAYPPVSTVRARTGRVPIVLFDALEPQFRILMKQNNLRAYYRGRRFSNNAGRRPTTTMRRDATHVVFYYK
jgi:hypothetical protein